MALGLPDQLGTVSGITLRVVASSIFREITRLIFCVGCRVPISLVCAMVLVYVMRAVLSIFIFTVTELFVV